MTAWNPLRRRPLLDALLRRELRGGTSVQRRLVTAAAGTLCGVLGADAAAGAPRGIVASIVAEFPTLTAFGVGALAGARLVARIYEDAGAGWLTPLCAAGTRRTAYLGQLAAALFVAACADLGLALGAFVAARAVAGAAPPLHAVAAALVAAPPWLAAVLALACLCALALGERTRARFVLLTLLLAPYLATFLFAFLNDDRALPRALGMVLLYGVPLWSTPLTPRLAAVLLLYAAVVMGAALLLARARIDRCA